MKIREIKRKMEIKKKKKRKMEKMRKKSRSDFSSSKRNVAVISAAAKEK